MSIRSDRHFETFPAFPASVQALHGDSNTISVHSTSPARAHVPLLSILLYTTLMSLASGLGAVPFLLFGRLKPYWAGIANALAVGVMMTASFDLLHEGAPHSPALTVMGMVIGALFIKASQDYLSRFEPSQPYTLTPPHMTAWPCLPCSGLRMHHSRTSRGRMHGRRCSSLQSWQLMLLGRGRGSESPSVEIEGGPKGS